MIEKKKFLSVECQLVKGQRRDGIRKTFGNSSINWFMQESTNAKTIGETEFYRLWTYSP